MIIEVHLSRRVSSWKKALGAMKRVIGKMPRRGDAKVSGNNGVLVDKTNLCDDALQHFDIYFNDVILLNVFEAVTLSFIVRSSSILLLNGDEHLDKVLFLTNRLCFFMSCFLVRMQPIESKSVWNYGFVQESSNLHIEIERK